MAYSDYGAFVYKNGMRRTDKEDVPAFCFDIETFAADISHTNRVLWKFSQPEGYNKVFNHSDRMYHGVCGDGPIRIACYKQGLPRIFEATNDAIEVISYYDSSKIDRYTFGQLDFKYKEYHFHFESDDSYDSNSPYIAEMTEPDGIHWRCEYDYEYGAGFEDE